MKRLISCLSLCLSVATVSLFPLHAHAHDDATLDKMKAPHGGQIRMAGAYHFELVLNPKATQDKDSNVAVYLSNHGDGKIASAGVSGNIVLLSSKGKTTLALTPAGDNQLSGTGKYQAEPGLKAIVSLSFPDKSTAQARFTPLANAANMSSTANTTPAAPSMAMGHQHQH